MLSATEGAGRLDPAAEAPRTALGPGGEFDRIRSFLGSSGAELPAEVRVGPGDDGAVLDGGWVLSTDLTVEGVHFRTSWLTPRQLGYRAAAVALSDLAAMGARPVGGLASVALSPSEPEEVGVALHRGIREALAEVGGALLGGDLTASPGPRIVDLAVVGRTRRPTLRSGSRPGDEVWVTGRLGGAAGAVRAWNGDGEPSPGLRERFLRPRARIREARWLRERCEIRAMIDLSDGLGGDAGHLAAAGSVALRIRGEAVPVDVELAELVGEEEALALALGGGEDYELLFVAAPDTVEPLRPSFTRRFELPLTRVGRVDEGAGVVWIPPGHEEPAPLPEKGFDHYADSGEGEPR